MRSKQASFADLEYASKKKVTRRERFLSELDALVPWSLLVEEIEPFYPKGVRGRPPMGVERMLRMYIAQQCFALSDEGIEDAVYDSQALRAFVGVDLSRESAPDATTLLKFRRLLEQHKLSQRIFSSINTMLKDKGLLLKEGSVVDATIISAPSSTKNKRRERDPQMHQSKKGQQYYFGMKAHIGADAHSGIVHTLSTTPANTHDITQAHALLHGEEQYVFADSGYRGVEKRKEAPQKQAQNKVRWHVAMTPSKRRALPATPSGYLQRLLEKCKARVRAKVEHPFHIVKNIFGMKKVRYKGLAKNKAQLFTLFALANLQIAKRDLLALSARGAS